MLHNNVCADWIKRNSHSRGLELLGNCYSLYTECVTMNWKGCRMKRLRRRQQSTSLSLRFSSQPTVSQTYTLIVQKEKSKIRWEKQ